MTTRELLRACAAHFEGEAYATSGDDRKRVTGTAAALRAIADRFDAEMDRAAAHGSWGTGQQEALARLDAPVKP